MNKKYTKRESNRITENINNILKESKFRFNNQNEAWNDLDKKIFYMLGFASLFIGFIIVNDLFDIFSQDISIIFKIFLLSGLILIFIASYLLIKIILPAEFKTSASVKDLLNSLNQNRLFNSKFHLINIYEKMNNDNNVRLNKRAEIFKISAYLILSGLFLIILSKSQLIISFLFGQNG